MKKKILIVEDNPANMRLVEMIFKDKGYSLLKAIDGEEALDMTVKEQPDLIIMDVQLPKIDGLEATRRIRQMPVISHIPIIALTAYAMKGDKEKAIQAGCNVYLSKPMDIRELPGLVVNMMMATVRKDLKNH